LDSTPFQLRIKVQRFEDHLCLYNQEIGPPPPAAQEEFTEFSRRESFKRCKKL
jgi:hypothetical protein